MSSSLEKPIIKMIGDKKYSCKLLPKPRTIRVRPAKKNPEEESIYEELEPEEPYYAEVGPAEPFYEKPMPLYEVPVTRSRSRSRKGLYSPVSKKSGGARKTYKRKRTHKKKKKTRRLRQTRK